MSIILVRNPTYEWQEKSCSGCGICAQYGQTLTKEPMKSIPLPSLPWEIISQDLFTLEQRSYLVTVCHFSDWVEVDELMDTLSTTIVNKTKTIDHNLEMAEQRQRNTPQRGHSYSPAQRMLCRHTRTKFPTPNKVLVPRMINRTTIQEELEHKRSTSKTYYDRAVGPQHDTLRPGQYAYARPPPQQRRKPWIHGQITREEPSRSYTLKTSNGMIRRNRVHIIPATPPPSDSGPTSHKRASLTDVEAIPIILPSRPPKKEITVTNDGQEPLTPISPHEPSTPIPPTQRTPIPLPELSERPTRTKRVPERLKDYVLHGLELLLK
ncbi:Hypothetical predicted protein [Paramuricea clavata]|uniref:Uncharacterized protein n=1 Tax=Paramuricea clavata TaxID=317549 RepID=A0A6S7HG38_PARCT|nr:Hypothetical predicted protein [Paramuricea clavata]